MPYISRDQTELAQQARDGLRDDLQITLIANPSLFPLIVEALPLATILVDEIDGLAVTADELRERRLVADGDCCSAIAVKQLLRRGCLAQPVVRGDDGTVLGG